MADVVTDWREEYAYTLGLQAYLYGFSWVFMSQQRWQWVTQPVNPDKTPYVGALNHFWHAQAIRADCHLCGQQLGISLSGKGE